MAYDPSAREIILQKIQATWTWSGGDWTALKLTSEPSNAFYQWSMAEAQSLDGVVGYGPDFNGQSGGQTPWLLTGGSWSQLPAGGPNASHAILGHDIKTNSVIVASDGQTFALDRSGWRHLSPVTALVPLTEAGITADGTSGKILVFGGVSAAGALTNATWTWDGSTWAQA